LCSIVVDSNNGKVSSSPFDVYLDDNSNAVQPDITVVLNDRLGIINPEGHIQSVPDILVEVLPPGNWEHDLLTKKISTKDLAYGNIGS